MEAGHAHVVAGLAVTVRISETRRKQSDDGGCFAKPRVEKHCLSCRAQFWSSRLRRGVAVRAQETPRFTSGVDSVSVTVTGTGQGRPFVSGLTKDDFTIFEDVSARDVVYSLTSRSSQSGHPARSPAAA